MGVRDLDSEEQVQQSGEDRVADAAIEPRHGVAVDPPLEPGAEHEIVAVLESLHERRQLVDRIRAVRVAHYDVLAPGLLQAREVGAAVAASAFADDRGTVLGGDLGRPVRRVVVDDDHLAAAARPPDSLPGLFDDGADRFLLVEAGNHDRDLHVRRHAPSV
jgi:hypothetical protein